jgi:hypothetical protein
MSKFDRSKIHEALPGFLKQSRDRWFRCHRCDGQYRGPAHTKTVAEPSQVVIGWVCEACAWPPEP